MDAPLAIILEMVRTVLVNTINTLGSLFGLFGSLLGSLVGIGGTGGVGFVVAILVLALVLFFLGKFILGSWKTIAILFIVGLIIIWLLVAGSGM